MKAWFPFTSYDFYAYLTAGMMVLAAYDLSPIGGILPAADEWTLVSGTFWAAVAYLIVHLVAMPSSGLLEYLLARHFFYAPTDIILGTKDARKRERVLRVLAGAREYKALPDGTRRRVCEELTRDLGVEGDKIEAEDAFETAFPIARRSADAAKRLDDFINLYGMARNVSFAALLAAATLAWSSWYENDMQLGALALGALLLSIGLFMRFMKFYSAYAREVFRTYGSRSSKSGND